MKSRNFISNHGKTIRLAIYEKSPLYREGLSLLLQRKNFIRVSLETGFPSEIIEAVEKEKVDFCLFSIYLDDNHWIELWPLVNQIGSRIPVMILNNSLRENLILQAMNEGIQGYFSGDLTGEDVTQAIQEISNGSIMYQSKPTGCSLKNGKPPQISSNLYGLLTAQERRISELMVLGLRNKEIGNRLTITEKTVKCHVNRIFKKLNIKRRGELRNGSIKELSGN